MKTISTLVFDLDGTLLDTLDDLTNSVNYALQHHGYPLRPKAEVRRFLGNGIANLMRLSAPHELPETDGVRLLQTFREHYIEHSLDCTQPYPGIPDLLESLQYNGIKMAIVSNKLQPAVSDLNDRFFHQYITTAIGESTTVRRKPNPDAVLSAMEVLGSTKEETLYVGDSEVDIQTARNAGIPCVAVSWGFRDREELEMLHPDYLVNHPSEILKIVLQTP